jgi:2-keto-4-pentenoate hydratase/2-oxohepta-3-ene-1,7-dioic acid hydratase in catechol pathway
MRLASYLHHGKPSFGIVTDGGIIDLREGLGDTFTDLRSLLSGDGLAQAEAMANQTPTVDLASITWLPTIPNPDKILCVGLNYEEHRIETANKATENPTIFLRLPSSQMGHLSELVCPAESIQLDYEGEVAVIIGKGGRRIKQANALEHVAGYSCYNDGSVRDWQRHTGQFTPGKNFVGTGGFGPWMVTTQALGSNPTLRVTTKLNGQVMQDATQDMMIHSIAKVIAYVSTFCPLVPGDVIACGTPGGVGARRDPQVWMKHGDTCEITVEGVGTLINPVVKEQSR